MRELPGKSPKNFRGSVGNFRGSPGTFQKLTPSQRLAEFAYERMGVEIAADIAAVGIAVMSNREGIEIKLASALSISEHADNTKCHHPTQYRAKDIFDINCLK